MDDRIEAFMVNVLALKGEDASAIHEGVCGPPTSCAQLFAAVSRTRWFRFRVITHHQQSNEHTGRANDDADNQQSADPKAG